MTDVAAVDGKGQEGILRAKGWDLESKQDLVAGRCLQVVWIPLEQGREGPGLRGRLWGGGLSEAEAWAGHWAPAVLRACLPTVPADQ